MPSLAATLRRRLPGIRLDLHGELLTPEQVRRLVDGSLDLALLRPPVRAPGSNSRSSAASRSSPCCPPATRLRRPIGCWSPTSPARPSSPTRADARSVVHEAVEATCEAHGFLPAVALEVAETATLVSFVAAGIGVSLVPASVSHLSIAGAVYRPLADEHAQVDLAIAWRRDDRSPALRRALGVVRDELAA